MCLLISCLCGILPVTIHGVGVVAEQHYFAKIALNSVVHDTLTAK